VISARKLEVSPRFLSEDERVRIADLRRAGMGVRAIGGQLGRSPSTISRELRRNCERASGQCGGSSRFPSASSDPPGGTPDGPALPHSRRRAAGGLRFLLVHYAIRTLMHQAALDGGIDPDRVSFTRTLRLVRRQATAQAALSPSWLARALTRALAEIQRHRLTRRPRSNPRVIKRKMSNWKLKRAQHRGPRQPSQRPITITIVAATKTGPARRSRAPAAPA
jgi:hypothetical protein